MEKGHRTWRAPNPIPSSATGVEVNVPASLVSELASSQPSPSVFPILGATTTPCIPHFGLFRRPLVTASLPLCRFQGA